MHIRVLLDTGQHLHSLLEHTGAMNLKTFSAGRWRPIKSFWKVQGMSKYLCYQAGPTNIPFYIHLLHPFPVSMWPESRGHEMAELTVAELSDSDACKEVYKQKGRCSV